MNMYKALIKQHRTRNNCSYFRCSDAEPEITQIDFLSQPTVEEEEEELYLPRHRLVEVEAILILTLQTYRILSAIGQF